MVGNNIIFKNPLIAGFTIFDGRVWIVVSYFLFEKETYNGLLLVFGIQRYVMNISYNNEQCTSILN